jgi:hypothetical protein
MNAMIGFEMRGCAEKETQRYAVVNILGSDEPIQFACAVYGGAVYWPCSLSDSELPLFEALPSVQPHPDYLSMEDVTWWLSLSTPEGSMVMSNTWEGLRPAEDPKRA